MHIHYMDIHRYTYTRDIYIHALNIHRVHVCTYVTWTCIDLHTHKRYTHSTYIEYTRVHIHYMDMNRYTYTQEIYIHAFNTHTVHMCTYTTLLHDITWTCIDIHTHMTYTYTHYIYTQCTCAHTWLITYNSTPGTGSADKSAQHKFVDV